MGKVGAKLRTTENFTNSLWSISRHSATLTHFSPITNVATFNKVYTDDDLHISIMSITTIVQQLRGTTLSLTMLLASEEYRYLVLPR